jgi:signal transduction histidine kinase/ligand-binding sensor domain-containing protein/DNA-binding response OmpR family regulator
MTTYYHSDEDSLSINSNSVLCVQEDSRGNFWIGTIAGLQRFDREQAIFIDYQPLSSSLPMGVKMFGHIRCILEDSKKNIWISSNGNGIIRLKNETLEPVFYMLSNSNICSNNINCLYEDKYGNIWIGSADNGISVLNTDNSSLINYINNPADPLSLSNNNISSICGSSDGSVLIGTMGSGVNKFNINNRSFERFALPAGNLIFTLYCDASGKLWIGTDGNGLFFYDPETKKIQQYESKLTHIDLRTAKIHTIIQDRQGNMWFSLYQNGVLMSPPVSNPFRTMVFNPYRPEKSISNHCVLSFLKDKKDQLWIGTDGGGLYKFDKQGNLIRHYLHTESSGDLPGNVVLSIFEDSKGRIWTGFYLHCMHRYDPQGDRFVPVPPANRELLTDITVFAEDKKGNLWTGSMGKGACMYQADKNQVTAYQFFFGSTGNQILSNYVNTLIIDRNQSIWIGSSEGLNQLNPETGVFTDYAVKDSMKANKVIYSLLEDDENLWIGTRNGLSLFNPVTGKSVTYNRQDGLPNDVICGIEKDRNGDLWVSTNMGLSMFNKETSTFSNYFLHDGLQDNEFRRGAHFMTREGELFFGGINGVTHFFPQKLHSDHQLLNLMFTNLFIYNQKITPRDKTDRILTKDLNYTDKLKLPYSTKNFTIGFIAVEFNNPGKVTYFMKMEGFDPDWKTVPMESHLATYTNLNPGAYTFKVKAFIGNEETKEKAIQIVITPPFWLSWQAKVLYVIAILLIIYFVYKEIVGRMEKKKEDMKKLHEEQIMQSKLQFFTDISHEIRTPLTLVLTPLESLIKDTTPGKLQNTYLMIHQNGERILRLINQLMDIRKLDRGQMKLKAEQTDIVHFLGRIMESFNEMAQKKGIACHLVAANDLPSVWIDQDKIDKIIFNLLSNAFKFTPDGGCIEISVSVDNDQLKIAVSDTGSGVLDEFKELIFNRFYQIPDTNTQKMGTGIGLHLSRSLTELHKGKIFVENNHPEGAVFIVLLPLGKTYFDETEIADESVANNSISPVVIPEKSYVSREKTKKKKYKILIVEDDLDIRAFLEDELSEEYHVLINYNGKDGLKTTIRELPDCIITDLMMPVMDGIAFTKKVKTNEKTCHIPVIILTAHTNINQQIEGLQTGADAYITKPFNIDILKVRINKLVEQREMIRQKFESKPDEKEADIKTFTSDERLLQKFELLIRDHISDSELSVEYIAKELGLSRSQLQRRIKNHTRQNPSDYIRIIRLKYAKKLLETRKIPIAEIAYASGFSSLAYFSGSFREYYGMSPSAYGQLSFNQV